MKREFPQHRMNPGEIAFLDEWAGVLRPEFAVMAASAAAQRRGARLVTGSRVTDLEPVASGVRVRCADQEWTVKQVLLTAGPWTNRFVPELAAHVRPKKVVMTWYHPRGPIADYEPTAFPIFIRDTDQQHIFGIPTLDGGSVKVAPHAPYGDLNDADQLDRNVDASELVPINEAVSQMLPGLVPTPVRIASYMDAYTTDGHAIVGALPGVDNIYVLGGFSGHGFKMAPAFGQVAAELATDGKTGLPIEHLDPTRFLSHA